jgi:hypothetical protein
MSEADVVTELTNRVQAELAMLPEDSRAWFEEHRIAPREISVSADPDSARTIRVWLMTDHTGNNDASSRVVYDATTKMFGLVMELRTGVLWYMGSHGSFVDAVESI